MADDIRYDHDGMDALLREAQSIIDDSRSVTTDDSGIDPKLAETLRAERESEDADSEKASEDTTKAAEANHRAEELGTEAAKDLESTDTTISDEGVGSGDVSSSPSPADDPGDIATHTTAAAPDTSGALQDAVAQQQAAQQAQAQSQAAQQQAAQQAAMQQQSDAQQQAAQQAAMQQQQAQQAAAQQQAAQQAQSQAMQQAQLNAQQQAAWQAAMQQQQAQQEMAQMNYSAQTEALQQTGATQEITAEDVRMILDELYADEGNHVEGGEPSGGSDTDYTETLPASDTENLGGAANVSLEKVTDGPLSKEEVASIINQACDLNGVSDDPEIRQQFINTWMHMAEHESGLNPGAANGWDSNAVGATQSDGFPAQSSRGLLQCIPETFSTYHVAGTSNSIYDPLASAAASINYTMDRYGVGPDGSGLAEFAGNRGIDPKSGDVTGGYLGY